MPSHLSRRRLLSASAAALVGAAGCLAPTTPQDRTTHPPGGPTTDDRTGTGAGTETGAAGPEPAIASVSVADFVRYPLAGVHPHVHRRADTQYVTVGVAADRDAERIREQLSLSLDGDAVGRATRQPWPWRSDAVEVAFAVSKSDTYDAGLIRFGDDPVRTLSDGVLARLNAPPVFEVGPPTVSPDELETDEQRLAMVRFDLTNTGPGVGTFGASLSGNYLSGSNTVTATVESGAEREVRATVDVVGKGETATVTLDWGTDEWSGTIPVVGPTAEPTTTDRSATDRSATDRSTTDRSTTDRSMTRSTTAEPTD